MNKNKLHILKALGIMLLAYIAVTAVGVAHTVFNALVLQMQAPEIIHTVYDYPAYAATVPFHPLYNIILWPLFALCYFRWVKPQSAQKSALVLGLIWCFAAIAIDTLGWVIIPHPYSMTWKEFFVDYQPWVTLIYLTIFAAPFIGAYFYKKQKLRKA